MDKIQKQRGSIVLHKDRYNGEECIRVDYADSQAIALLLEKYPDMSNKDVKLRIRERALDLGLPHNQQGWGKLDVGRLLE